MRAITYSLDDETLAEMAAKMLQRITGDFCFLRKKNGRILIVRIDATGKDVTC